jgi:hypothetical protein
MFGDATNHLVQVRPISYVHEIASSLSGFASGRYSEERVDGCCFGEDIPLIAPQCLPHHLASAGVPTAFDLVVDKAPVAVRQAHIPAIVSHAQVLPWPAV